MKTMGGEESEESGQNISVGKELGQKTLKSLKRGLGKLWRRHRGNALITEYDPCYKVAYLGNVLTGWAKGEGCVEKPISTLWRNYVSSNRPDVTMRLTVTNGGLTATTKDHGLTEYWAHRVTYCVAPVSHPRLFVWVYRHEGRRLRPELRCHAALCSKESTARRLATTLNTRLQQALIEFRRDKVSRQNARLSLANSVYENPSLPRRKILLSIGGQNYRPPLERSKSAPKLSAIEEDSVAEEIEQKRLLEELRSLENVARSWQDRDGWRLALVDALNRTGASSEYLDENGSISSGCETASTSASSEERALTDDNHTTVETESRNGRRVLFSDIRTCSNSGLRRNSDGSPNFMTCTGSPRFHCARNISRKRFSSSSRCEDDDDLNENEAREQELAPQSSNVFEFEDTEVFQEVVEYSPQGSENPSGRRIDVKGEKYPGRVDQIDELLEEEEEEELPFGILDSLDEEEADSDESGYVEAPPKTLLGQEDISKDNNNSLDTVFENIRNDSNNLISNYDKKILSNDVDDNNDANRDSLQFKDDRKDSSNKLVNNNLSSSDKFQDTFDDSMNIQKLKERDKVDFIKCPISETIKKLANASLKNSKSLEISTSNCLNAINSLKNSKSFEGVRTINYDEESPSLLQRKQLLAQQGVKV